MKIYIEEKLPKSCEACRFLIHCGECEGYGNYCPMLGERSTLWPGNKRHEKCPLEKKEKQPHGEWKPDGTCSKCGVYSSLNKDTAYFCPNCGADMRRKEGEANEQMYIQHGDH